MCRPDLALKRIALRIYFMCGILISAASFSIRCLALAFILLFSYHSYANDPQEIALNEYRMVMGLASKKCLTGYDDIAGFANTFATLLSHRAIDDPRDVVNPWRAAVLVGLTSPAYLREHGILKDPDISNTKWNNFSGHHQLLCVKDEDGRKIAYFGVSRGLPKISWARIYRLEVVRDGSNLYLQPLRPPVRYKDEIYLPLDVVESTGGLNQ